MSNQSEKIAQALFPFVVVLTISACTSTSDPPVVKQVYGGAHTVTATPSIQTATIMPSSTPTLSHPTEEHVWVLPTTSFTKPVPEIEIDLQGPCLTRDHVIVGLPNPDDLQWRLRQDQLFEMTGLTREVHNIDLSPEGSWILLALSAPMNLEYGLVDESALYLTNMDNSAAWTASNSGYIYAHRYVWLPDSRFLWVDQGKLYAADLDGSNRVDLEAPEALWQVWQGKDGIVLAQGESRMWLLDPVARTWSRMDIPSFSLTSVAHDGSYALSLGNAQDDDMDFALYRFDLDVDAQAELLMQSEIVGGHGEPPRRPHQFGTGKYWSSGEWLSFEGLSFGALGIIDVEQGNVTHISNFLGLEKDIYTIMSFSPDGQWINVREIETRYQAIVDIDAPETLSALEGTILAWLEDADTVLVFKKDEVEEESQPVTKANLLKVNLRDGSSSVFLTDLEENTPEILASGDRIFVSQDISEISAYTPEGHLLGTLIFPQGVVPSIESLGDHSLAISFEATAKHDHSGELCQKRTLWIWQR